VYYNQIIRRVMKAMKVQIRLFATFREDMGRVKELE
jgi:hypothetical protein